MDDMGTDSLANGGTWYTISGINPEPWSASEGAVGKKNGKAFIHFHKPAQLRQYQESVKDEFPLQNPHAVEIEGDIELTFYFWRQLALSEITEENTKKRRAHQADATNLQKALEDALQGIVYKNDRDIRSIRSVIVAQGSDVSPFILVHASRYLDIEELLAAGELREALEPDTTRPESNLHDVPVEDLF